MSDKLQEIRTELEQYQADMVSISKLRLLGLAGDLLIIAEKQELELRAIQPDEQMSLLRIAQEQNEVLKARLGRVVRVVRVAVKPSEELESRILKLLPKFTAALPQYAEEKPAQERK